MADEAPHLDVGGMLDPIRRQALLERNPSEDRCGIEVDAVVAEAPFQIQLQLPWDKWSSPKGSADTPLGLRYESRMVAWNPDYMAEAFDAIYGRHPAISGPWVTVIRTGDRRTYHGRDTWDMNRVASMFRPQTGLEPQRVAARARDTVLEFHRDDEDFTEVTRFGTDAVTSGRSELLERILQNVVWGSPPTETEVTGIQRQIADLIRLFPAD